MKRINRYLIILIAYLILGAYLYHYHNAFANSNFFFATVTFIVGSLAFYIYTQQKNDAKRDAARLIIQEIRRAEDIISDYKQMEKYQFAKKIIATNSWNKNIHYFVGDLTNDELDKISDLYSTGEFLDSEVRRISEITLDFLIELEKGNIQSKIGLAQREAVLESSSAKENTIFKEQVIQVEFPPVWKPRLDVISKKLEPIYHSNIITKLKNIAKVQ